VDAASSSADELIGKKLIINNLEWRNRVLICPICVVELRKSTTIQLLIAPLQSQV
jgi:hypothetical protein